MDGPRPHLGIVVVNYGSADLLTQNLAALDRTGLEPCSVVVVDNPMASTERPRVRELAAAGGWHVVEPDRNLGFGVGANVGADRAMEEGAVVLAFLNPDVAVDAATLERLVAVVTEDRRALVSPRIHRPDGSLWFVGARLDLRTGFTSSLGGGDPGGVRWTTGACFVVHRELWELVGGFDDRYFLYWEDIDLSRRVVDAGGTLVVEPGLAAVHDVGATQPGAGKSPTYAYFNCRNRLLFAAGRCGRARRLVWVARSPRYAVRVVTRDGRRAALRRPRLLWAAVRGTLAGTGAVLRSFPTPAPAQATSDEATATISRR